jgi:hypothetical protein
MMTSNVGELVRDLRATLEAIGLGLIEGLPDRLLDAEPRLAEIAARLSSLSPTDLEVHRADVVAAHAALRRCQRLGGNVLALNEVYAARRGYGPSGHYAPSDAAGVLQTRV